MKLLILVIFVLIALAVIFAARAWVVRRKERELAQGYEVQRFDRTNEQGDLETVVRIKRGNYRGRTEAVIPLDDPNHSEKVIEAVGAAQAKVDDWNSTDRALEV